MVSFTSTLRKKGKILDVGKEKKGESFFSLQIERGVRNGFRSVIVEEQLFDRGETREEITTMHQVKKTPW